MAAPEGTITVKLHLDATEFHAELDKVIKRLKQLADVAPEAELQLIADSALGEEPRIRAVLHAGEQVHSAQSIAEHVIKRADRIL